MPKHRVVPTLLELSLDGVGSLVCGCAGAIHSEIRCMREPQRVVRRMQVRLDRLREQLVQHAPPHLYAKMAHRILLAVKRLIETTKKSYLPNTSISAFLTEMNVVVSLTEVVLSPGLRQVDFQQWPRIMRYVLYKNLGRLTGLEELNLGSCSGGWKENDHCLAEGLSRMRKLRSLCLCFDASDHIVQTVCESCPSLLSLDLTSSRSVTDRSVRHLLALKQLRELQLHRTSVTATGLATLVAALPRLTTLGRCDEFAAVVRQLHSTLDAVSGPPYSLRSIHTRGLSTDVLRLLVDMFPSVEAVCLFLDEQPCDLTVLISLDCIKELKLLSCAFHGDYLKQLLEVRGQNITSLHLEHVEELDFQVLVNVSQCCPHLKNLVFYNCDFNHNSGGGVPNLRGMPLRIPPFLSLERLFWVVDGAVSHLEFILSSAFGIRDVHLGSSTGITHSSVVNVLSTNPMRQLEELRVLYSSDMSMRTVELLLASCVNLRVLSELESWQGINQKELKAFRKYITNNNFDLDIRPTLSLTT